MELWRVGLVAVLVAIVLGFTAYDFSGGDGSTENYCQGIEEGLNKNTTLNGTNKCYTPEQVEGEIDVPEELENRTELACVCVNEYKGQKRIYPIHVS